VTSPRRSGRRPGDSGTREAILAAAKESFAASGYDATTIRGVGRAAAVDPALVHHFFGTKQDLFVAAMELPIDPAKMLPAAARRRHRRARGTAGPDVPADLGRHPRPEPDAGAAAQRDQQRAGSGDAAGVPVRRHPRPLARAAGHDRPELRASLVGSQMMGLAFARYVVRLQPLATADADTIASTIGPTIQRYLTGDMPEGRSQTSPEPHEDGGQDGSTRYVRECSS
jgi:AcrR family transcriptional regulator